MTKITVTKSFSRIRTKKNLKTFFFWGGGRGGPALSVSFRYSIADPGQPNPGKADIKLIQVLGSNHVVVSASQ
jgi:hypothetical protein